MSEIDKAVRYLRTNVKDDDIISYNASKRMAKGGEEEFIECVVRKTSLDLNNRIPMNMYGKIPVVITVQPTDVNALFRIPPSIDDYRVLNGVFGSPKGHQQGGMFQIPKDGKGFMVMASTGLGWEHVSISVFDKEDMTQRRCPTWEEMCEMKNLFWEEDATVIQYHPSKKDYRNLLPYVLHLWRPLGAELPTPDPDMVG